MRCVYNNKTGEIFAFISDSIDVEAFAAQWPDMDWINNAKEYPPSEVGQWAVDLDTKTIVKLPQT